MFGLMLPIDYCAILDNKATKTWNSGAYINRCYMTKNNNLPGVIIIHSVFLRQSF